MMKSAYQERTNTRGDEKMKTNRSRYRSEVLTCIKRFMSRFFFVLEEKKRAANIIALVNKHDLIEIYQR